MKRAGLGWLLVVVPVAASCARPGSPPGGTPVRTPPAVDSTVPGPLAVVPGFKGPVRIQFDRRLSEQGADGSVTVSPATSKWRLHRKGDALVVSMDSAWRPGTIYRVVVAPTIQDLFHNKIRAPFELVFSTGPAIPETVVAGVVTDRLTGKPLDNARVDAIHQPDSLTYVATTDREGLFAMRHIPTGQYHVVAYLDQNRNDSLNAFEPRDTMSYNVAADTSLLALRLLPNDSTPAKVVRAAGEDSLHVRVTLDDALDPDWRMDSVSVAVWHLPDSVQVAVRRVMQLHVFEDEKKAEATAKAKAQTQADTLHRDTTRVVRQPQAQPPAPGRPAIPGARAGAAAAAGQGAPQPPPVLPSRDFIVELATPLVPRATYRVTVQGVTNISGLPGGGGSVTFEAPAPKKAAKPAAPDTSAAARDTSRVRRDTTAARRDTTADGRDTTAEGRDTTAARRDTTATRDTTAARADTTRVRGDTTAVRRDTATARDTTAAGADTTHVRRDTTSVRSIAVRRLGAQPGRVVTASPPDRPRRWLWTGGA